MPDASPPVRSARPDPRRERRLGRRPAPAATLELGQGRGEHGAVSRRFDRLRAANGGTRYFRERPRAGIPARDPADRRRARSDRKSVVKGKGGSVRGDLGGGSIIKKKK